jgi:hypothetical protein
MWSCRTCSRVLHLSCIKQWARAALSPEGLSTRDVLDGWRCPACNLYQLELPGRYTCWCGNHVTVLPLPGLPPRSCGRACSRVRKSCCDRPCKFICHAGPCPPCGYKKPLQEVTNQLSENRSRLSRFKRTFEEIDEPIIIQPNNISKTRLSFSHPFR